MRWIQFVLDCLLGQEPGIRSQPGERLRAAVRSESRAGVAFGRAILVRNL